MDAGDYYKLKSKEKSHIPVDVDMDEYRTIPCEEDDEELIEEKLDAINRSILSII